jgi:hypothetical protein
MAKIINRDTLAEQRHKNETSSEYALFKGSALDNLSASLPETHLKGEVAMASVQYAGSSGQRRLLDEIGTLQNKFKNAAQEPNKDVLKELVQKILIDITRRAQEAGDLTSVIAREETNLAFARDVNLLDILPYRGKFEAFAGTNGSVPLIEQALGSVETVSHTIRALGWKTTLGNVLFNDLHSLTKVNQAVADAYTDMRNSRTVGKIVAATYVASQQQAADTTSGASFDYKMYNTLRKAIKKLRTLKDPLTDRPIAAPRIAILCNSANTWDIERVVRGQLMSGGGNGLITTQNLGGLPITEIIEYDQGITNGFTWGKETLAFPGVTAGKAYVFVPREYAWVLNKRPLTLETGAGNVLQLSQEERSWYAVQTEFDRLFFGSSFAGTTLGAGYGAVIEVVLPADS